VTASAYVDGGARGNPGPAGIGVVINIDGETPIHHNSYIGEATNNVAEYSAIIACLEKCLELGVSDVRIHGDSELVVRQMTGRYRVKHPNLIPLHAQVSALAARLQTVEFIHVVRKKNVDADRLVNQAINQALSDR
jgi:ribonuclease HI